jgi:hypothetical protein
VRKPFQADNLNIPLKSGGWAGSKGIRASVAGNLAKETVIRVKMHRAGLDLYEKMRL